MRSEPRPIHGPPLRLERRSDGRLWANAGTDRRPVQPTRCFPWSEPQRYISLRDDERDEVALVVDPAELDPQSRDALEASLAEAGFVMEIVKIFGVDVEVEIRTWKVETRQGARSFQTGHDAWPRQLPGGGYLIRDVAGDLYHISDPEGLDPRSRRYLWAFVE